MLWWESCDVATGCEQMNKMKMSISGMYKGSNCYGDEEGGLKIESILREAC